MDSSIPSIDSRTSILLVMDYEPAILGNLPGADGLLKRTAGAIATGRRMGAAR